MPEMHEKYQAGRILESERLDLDRIQSGVLSDVWRYWDEKRGANFAPSLKEFRIDELPTPIVPYTIVVDFLGPELDFYYRFFGTRMVEIVGRELTGKTLIADGLLEYGILNAQMFPIVIAERRPICTHRKWVSPKKRIFDTITIRLPLSDNGTDVTNGVTALQFTDKSAERDTLAF